MKTKHALLAGTLAVLLSVTAQAAVVIEHVTVLDGIHAAQPDMTVVITGERISAVTPGALAHSVAGRKIDGRGKYLLPGMMDIHIHLAGGFDAAGKLMLHRTAVPGSQRWPAFCMPGSRRCSMRATVLNTYWCCAPTNGRERF